MFLLLLLVFTLVLFFSGKYRDIRWCQVNSGKSLFVRERGEIGTALPPSRKDRKEWWGKRKRNSCPDQTEVVCVLNYYDRLRSWQLVAEISFQQTLTRLAAGVLVKWRDWIKETATADKVVRTELFFWRISTSEAQKNQISCNVTKIRWQTPSNALLRFGQNIALNGKYFLNISNNHRNRRFTRKVTKISKF